MTTPMKSGSKPKSVKPPERRRGSQDQINRLITERTQMLVLYCRLAGLNPTGERAQREPAQKLLEEFCQVLIDYIAAGHFSLYDRLVNGQERRRQVADTANQLYPRISDTTSVALDFNDKYDCGDHCEITPAFEIDLSRLGEELAVRIELEDKLINQLLI